MSGTAGGPRPPGHSGIAPDHPARLFQLCLPAEPGPACPPARHSPVRHAAPVDRPHVHRPALPRPTTLCPLPDRRLDASQADQLAIITRQALLSVNQARPDRTAELGSERTTSPGDQWRPERVSAPHQPERLDRALARWTVVNILMQPVSARRPLTHPEQTPLTCTPSRRSVLRRWNDWPAGCGIQNWLFWPGTKPMKAGLPSVVMPQAAQHRLGRGARVHAEEPGVQEQVVQHDAV